MYKINFAMPNVMDYYAAMDVLKEKIATTSKKKATVPVSKSPRYLLTCHGRITKLVAKRTTAKK